MSVSITAHIESRYIYSERWDHLTTAPIASSRNFAAQLETLAVAGLPDDVSEHINDIASHLSSVEVKWSYATYDVLWTKVPVDLMFLLFYAHHTLETHADDGYEIRVVFEIC